MQHLKMETIFLVKKLLRQKKKKHHTLKNQYIPCYALILELKI